MFLLVHLIILLDFIGLSLFLALFAPIVILVTKQLNISFGNVLDGMLFEMTIPTFYVFLVLLVPNGPDVFYIVVGSNFIMTMGLHYSSIWTLLMTFKI